MLRRTFLQILSALGIAPLLTTRATSQVDDVADPWIITGKACIGGRVDYSLSRHGTRLQLSTTDDLGEVEDVIGLQHFAL